ncbi:transcriptional regulator [Sphaerochaeta pleomorpha str. Grapes]|uniref:Transcriptional regulator n=1 Tax=Sphaerochaeta pleomorpha (strain ATCC BAA-1885 / DSM 22778 / Grapes) TaxID=158190 RepID=G8QUD1_SPHPG|nr:substrate-binding domain-containing protein [Sphaerochaeta pleomorpha]AEV28101.1 transcriptional regulator [Sphaerochaeta pleomorpha str. Grapes]
MAKKKQCIGVFTASLDDAYQSTVWHAIEQSAQEKGFGSISFLGSRLGSPIASEASSNLAYYLANKRNIDGLIIIASSLETFLTSVDLKAFFASWADLPRVSIGMRIPGMSDVNVNGSKALANAIEHLIDEHGHTHFALIGGPVSHDEAISRMDTCLSTLKKRNISIDKRLIVSGTFTQDSGAEAVDRLCKTGLGFDALVCLNDRMAQGALEELTKKGIRVPEDVALIGFDGIESSLYTLPPLTTVVQPMHALGATSVAILDRLMKGGSEEHITLECTSIIRESCGCKPRFRYTPDLQELPLYASLTERQEIQKLIELIQNSDYDGLIYTLNHAMDTTWAEIGSITRWYEYLSFIEHQCRLSVVPDKRSLANLMGAAKAFTAEKIGRYQATKRVSAESSFETLRRVSAILAGAFELSDMFSNLKKGLKMFGIDRGYLVVFDKDKKKAQLLMDIEQEGKSDSSLPQEFKRTNLLPSSVSHTLHQGQWILMPLVYNMEPLGYLIVPIGIEIPALYDILQEQISSNLKGTLLLEQIKSHEKTLAQQVDVRTKDLIRTNRELSTEIKRRNELEKEVLEISNKTIERIGQDLHDDLCQHLLGVSLMVSSVKKTATDHQYETVETLDKISLLLSESITKIKTISRGMLPFEMEPHTFLQRIDALVGDTLRISHVDVQIKADPEFEIEDANAALHIFHILQEALNNSIKHSHSKHIEITLENKTDRNGKPFKVASVVDDGVGLPEHIREGGLGLRIMRSRANMAKAELAIKSSKKGTSVCIYLGRQGNGTTN